MTMDNVNVIGYTAWSLMDNFEWAEGYTERFGMSWVDFDDPNRPRTSKQSSFCYMDIMRNSFPAEGLEYCVKDSTDRPPWIPESTSTPQTTTGSSPGCNVFFLILIHTIRHRFFGGGLVNFMHECA